MFTWEEIRNTIRETFLPATIAELVVAAIVAVEVLAAAFFAREVIFIPMGLG